MCQFAAAWAFDEVTVEGGDTREGGDVRGTFIFVVAAADTDAILALVIVRPLLDMILALEATELVEIGMSIW